MRAFVGVYVCVSLFCSCLLGMKNASSGVDAIFRAGGQAGGQAGGHPCSFYRFLGLDSLAIENIHPYLIMSRLRVRVSVFCFVSFFFDPDSSAAACMVFSTLRQPCSTPW